MHKRLFALTQADGVSGDEGRAAAVAAEQLGLYCDVTIDRNHNVLGALRAGAKESDVHVLLDAHLDEIGMIVTAIGDDGFVQAGCIGGVQARSLPGSEVVIHGREEVYGVFGAMPPHLQKADEAKSVDPDACYIDTGYPAEALKERIRLGDSISFIGKPALLLHGRLMSKAMDDRACCAILVRVAERLTAEPPRCRVSICCNTKEEIGGQGARCAAFALRPTHAIAIDVTYADETEKPKAAGCPLGSGAAVGIAANLSRPMFKSLLRVAEQHDIAHTIEVMTGATHTDADALCVSREGVPSAVVSLPLRYMHTPNEICDPADLDSIVELLVRYVQSL